MHRRKRYHHSLKKSLRLTHHYSIFQIRSLPFRYHPAHLLLSHSKQRVTNASYTCQGIDLRINLRIKYRATNDQRFRTHKNAVQRRFCCQVDSCGKNFRRRQELQRHEAIHGNKRLKCRGCDYNTCRKDNLRRHARLLHPHIHSFVDGLR